MGRSFSYLIVSFATTTLANSLFMMAFIIIIYHATNSTLLASIVTILSVAAKMISGVLAPLFMDRYKLRNVVLFSQVLQVLLFISLAIYAIYFATSTHLLLYYLAIFFISYLEGVSIPAKRALIPRLVKEEKLVKANSLITTSNQTLLLLGWSMGGVLVATIGAKFVLWITVGLFILSVVSLFMIHEDKTSLHSSQPSPKKQKGSLQQGWRLIIHNPILRILTVMLIIEGLGSSVWIGAVTLVFVRDVLLQGEKWWGFINAGYYAGSILGGLLIWKFSSQVNQHLIRTMLVGATIFSLLLFTYAFVTIPLLSLLLVILMGPAYQARSISHGTITQRVVTAEELPKVYAATSTINNTVFGISVFGIGLLVDLIGVQMVYIISALSLGLATIYSGIRFESIDIKLETNRERAFFK